jgi:hypothetical protein
MRGKPSLWLFVGDLHVGSKEALTVKGEISNPRQRWLGQQWADMTKRIKAEAKTKSIRLMLGGDLVDLADIVDGTEMAVDLLRPLANVSDEVWGVYGTPYHVGEDGKEDRSVYGQLGAVGRRRNHHHWLMVDGGKLSWSHHGMKISQDPWNELNGHRQIAERLYWRAMQQGVEPVRFVMRHHVHRTPAGSPVRWRGTDVMVCPCWKFGDGFTGKHMPDGAPPTFGVGVITDGRMEAWTYEPPNSLL